MTADPETADPGTTGPLRDPDSGILTSAPAGWKRVLLGMLVGITAGAVLALLLPRERARSGQGRGDVDVAEQ